jgi:hypothetical protein
LSGHGTLYRIIDLILFLSPERILFVLDVNRLYRKSYLFTLSALLPCSGVEEKQNNEVQIKKKSCVSRESVVGKKYCVSSPQSHKITLPLDSSATVGSLGSCELAPAGPGALVRVLLLLVYEGLSY